MDLKKSWRTIAASLVGVSLLTVASISSPARTKHLRQSRCKAAPTGYHQRQG